MTELTSLHIERTETIDFGESVYTLHFCKSSDAETYELIAINDATKKVCRVSYSLETAADFRTLNGERLEKKVHEILENEILHT